MIYDTLIRLQLQIWATNLG